MNPNVFSVNKSFSRENISKLGALRVVDTLRHIRDVTVDGNIIMCEGLAGLRETIATTSTTSVSIHETPSIINREERLLEIKLITCRLGVMFVVVNHRLDFFYFAVDQSLTKDTPHSKFKDELKHENFKSIKDAIEAYSVYELVEDL